MTVFSRVLSHRSLSRSDDAIIEQRLSSKRNKRFFPFELRSRKAPEHGGICIDLLTASAHSRLLKDLMGRDQPFEDLGGNFIELDFSPGCLEVFAEALYSKAIAVRGPDEAIELLSLGTYLMVESLQQAMIGYLEHIWYWGPDSLMDADLALSLWAKVRQARRAVPDEEAVLQVRKAVACLVIDVVETEMKYYHEPQLYPFAGET